MIEAPLHDVAVHVVQAPGVRLLGADFVGRALLVQFIGGILAVPGVIVEFGRIVAETVSGLAAGAAGVFPLGLGRQAVGLAGLLREPFAIPHGRVVRHADGRVLLALVAVGFVDVGRRRAGDAVGRRLVLLV